jgi:uncharacterized protein
MIAIDTGAFVALFNQRDPNHQAVQSALRTIQEPLITTYPVLTETCYFLLSRPGKLTPPEFLRQVSQGLVEIFQLQPSHRQNSKRAMALRLTDASESHSLPATAPDSSLAGSHQRSPHPGPRTETRLTP